MKIFDYRNLYFFNLKKLGYFSKSVGGLSGSGQSSRDVLKILLDDDRKVVLISERSPFKGDSFLSNDPTRVRCIHPATDDSKKKITSWQKLKAYMIRSLAYRGIKLALIDSLGSHELFRSFGSAPKTETAIIVRESPDFFKNGSSKKSITWALDALKIYDHYIFVSRICQEKWLHAGLEPTKKSFYIPNCCREDIIDKIRMQTRLYYRQKLQLPCDDFLVVCLASIQPRKGQDLIIDAIDPLQEEIPSIYVCFVGPIITEWGEALREKIDQAGPDSRIKMIGRKSNALEYLYAADLLVLPSRSEAMPRTILEAMALETAVVASDVDGIPELIDHDQTGLLFPKNDIKGLVYCISRMAHFSNEIDRYRKAASEKYWSNFSRKHQNQRFKLALDKMLHN